MGVVLTNLQMQRFNLMRLRMRLKPWIFVHKLANGERPNIHRQSGFHWYRLPAHIKNTRAMIYVSAHR